MARLSQRAQAAYLTERDPVLGEVIASVSLKPLKRINDFADDYFATLLRSIISQQISTKAAASISSRFLDVFKGVTPTPKQLLKMNDDKLRSAGLSASKVTYLKDLAAHVADGRLDLVHVATLPEDEVMRELVAVKGIGPWTAEMFMMFSLRKDDVFSYGDLGLVNSITRLYKLRKPVTRARLEKIVNNWRPYRTLAARYLWAHLDGPAAL